MGAPQGPAGCPGCTCVLMDEPTVVPHTEACRVWIMEFMQGDEQGRARLEAHEKRRKRRQGTTEAIGGPDQGPATEEEQPVFPDNPEERIELKRSVAERATSSRQEKRPKASQPSKRPGALTIGSGPPLAKPKPSPTQGEKRPAETAVETLRETEADGGTGRPSQAGTLPEGAQMETGALTKQKKVFKTLIKRQVLDTYELRDTFLVFRKGPSTSSCPMRMRRTRNLVRRSVVY